jgi:predicted small lipoprotein YifL
MMRLVLVLVLLTLGGCATSTGPLWTPDSPRNGATQPVDPVYGTPIPGYPNVTGPS